MRISLIIVRTSGCFRNQLEFTVFSSYRDIRQMTARRKAAGRIMRNRNVAGIALAVTATALLLATELPQGLAKAAGGSAALAELAARSPGMRVGGVALKAKTPRAALAPIAAAAPGPGASVPGNAVASVLGTGVGPEGPIPTSGPVGSPGFSHGFLTPGVPGILGPGSGPGSTPNTDFGGISSPPIGGGAIIAPGGGGGGGSGGGTPGAGITPPGGGGAPGGGVIAPPAPLPSAGAIPEPSIWLMLMAGFGAIGSAMRRSRRVRLA